MKNQFFGDKRDLFKYDLICHLLKKSSKKSFTYIPMLTENEKNKQGEQRNYKGAVGAKNKKLVSFLEKHSAKREERNFEKISAFFKSEGIKANLYRPKVKRLSNKNREVYFTDIPPNLLQNTLVFIDPDTGMAPSKAEEKHLKYKELDKLLRKASKDTIFMIFQFGDRNAPNLKDHSPPPLLFRKTLAQTQRHSDKLTCLIGGRREGVYSHVAGEDICFFFICKDVSYTLALANLLADYKNNYPDRLETKEGEETFMKGNAIYDYGDNLLMKGPQKKAL